MFSPERYGTRGFLSSFDPYARTKALGSKALSKLNFGSKKISGETPKGSTIPTQKGLKRSMPHFSTLSSNNKKATSSNTKAVQNSVKITKTNKNGIAKNAGEKRNLDKVNNNGKTKNVEAPSVLSDRGFRPSDLVDSQKKNFLNQLTTRVFHRDTDSNSSHHEKIPLERLFTPASDASDIVPLRKKKAFASSCFYRSDHPTIDDQVELAHKISTSLIDETNKASKGQTMYMKRKNRSSKWIHQADLNGENDEEEDDAKSTGEKPSLKLLLSPKGMQDYKEVQKHYKDLLTSQSCEISPHLPKIDVSRQIGTDLESLESPTGKGAALFARRKKRMDKFIVDETTVKNSQCRDTSRGSSVVESDFSAHENTSIVQNGSICASSPINSTGAVLLPDLTDILTKPRSCNNSRKSSFNSKKSSTRSRSADSTLAKPHLTFSNYPTPIYIKCGVVKNQAPLNDSPVNLKQGSPPIFCNTNESLNSAETSFRDTKINGCTENHNNGGLIYTADVKVEQRTSIPSTPVAQRKNVDESDLASSLCLLSQLSLIRDEDKRKSFNLAPKGWGTYADFYTPVHLEA